MKLSITPVAVAVTMALGAAVAQAQTLPTFGSTSPADGGTNDGLYLAVWDDTSKATELVDLSLVYKTVALAKTAVMVTPTVGSNGWSSVSNFDGYASVDQLAVGTISNFGSVFPTVSSTTHYVVLSGNNSGVAALASAALTNPNPATQTLTEDIASAMLAESSAWNAASNTSPLVDLTGTTAYSAFTPSGLDDGALGVSGASFGVNVGTAAGFYQYVTNAISGITTLTDYSYNGQQGFWFLSSTGQLTWNLVASASTVPLPPAVWLFASGLIGLGLIGRRRQTGLGAAV